MPIRLDQIQGLMLKGEEMIGINKSQLRRLLFYIEPGDFQIIDLIIANEHELIEVKK